MAIKPNLTLKNRQAYFYSELALCFLFTGILFLKAISPGIKNWMALGKDIRHKQTELQFRYKTAEGNQQLKQEMAKIKEVYPDIEGMFFAPDDIPGAVKEIADISRDLQIEFFSLTPQSPQELKEYVSQVGFSIKKIPISIRIKTGYLKLLDFIKRIEDSKKFIKIDNLSIRKNPSTLQVHDVEMTVYVFSLQQKKQ